MPGCSLPPKGTFACSETLGNGIFMALLNAELSRGGSGNGAPVCVEQDGSFLRPEHIAIRNNPPENPECKPARRRGLLKPGVPAGESPRHHGSESPLRSPELPPWLLSLRERGFIGQPAVTERGRCTAAFAPSRTLPLLPSGPAEPKPDSTAALPKPGCAQLAPSWYPSHDGARRSRSSNPPFGAGSQGASTPWGRVLPSSPGLVWTASPSLLQLLLGPSKSHSSPLHPWGRGSSTSPSIPILRWARGHPPQ